MKILSKYLFVAINILYLLVQIRVYNNDLYTNIDMNYMITFTIILILSDVFRFKYIKNITKKELVHKLRIGLGIMSIIMGISGLMTKGLETIINLISLVSIVLGYCDIMISKNKLKKYRHQD